MAKRVLIVGGVAGGASCAARLRRLDEEAEIVLFDRGPHVSFANCGLPYFVGNVIADERSLLVASPELFPRALRHRRADAPRGDGDRPGAPHDPRARPRRSGGRRARRALRCAGALAGRGADPPAAARHRSAGHLRGADDSRHACASAPGSTSARRDARSSSAAASSASRWPRTSRVAASQVTVLEKLPQVMPPLDPRWPIRSPSICREQGVALHLGDGLAGFEPAAAASSSP